MDATVQIRIDSKTKQAVTKVFKDLGIDVSTGIKLFFHQVARTKSVPFPLLTENGFTPAQEKKILAESERTYKLFKAGKIKGHRTVESLFKDLNS